MVYIFGTLFLDVSLDFKEGKEPENVEMLALNEHFGDLSIACGTLFRSISNGFSWKIAADALRPAGEFWYWLFHFYVAFCSFALLNVMTGPALLLAHVRKWIGMSGATYGISGGRGMSTSSSFCCSGECPSLPLSASPFGFAQPCQVQAVSRFGGVFCNSAIKAAENDTELLVQSLVQMRKERAAWATFCDIYSLSTQSVGLELKVQLGNAPAGVARACAEPLSQYRRARAWPSDDQRFRESLRHRGDAGAAAFDSPFTRTSLQMVRPKHPEKLQQW